MLSLIVSKRTQKLSIGILVEQVSHQQQSPQAKSNKFPYYGILINTLLVWKSVMKIKQITETTTSGSIATVNSPLGGTQSRGNPSIYGGKKVGSLFKGKKTSAPYANSINESAEISEQDLSEQDLIVVPGQGRKSKTGFVQHGQSRLDHEVEMARSDLFSAAKNAQQVYLMIKDLSEEEGLEGWVQEKIIKANDYLNTIREYLEGKQVQGVDESIENNSVANALVNYIMKNRPDLLKHGADRVGDAIDRIASNVRHINSDNIGKVIKQIEYYVTSGNNDMYEGAKVDRMVKHIAKSEKKLGKSKDEAENIAWATANKRGMLDNKNKKA
jgi:hypothetical protein